MLTQHKSYFCFVAVLAALSFFPLAMPTYFIVDTFRDPLFSKIPLQFGEWQGKDIKLEERVYEILETRNVLSRIYENPKGEKVDLMLVGSQRDRRVAHPPEVCYVGSNFDIIDTKERDVELQGKKIRVKEFVARDRKNPTYKENVLYVYRAGDVFTTNYYAQQLHFVFARQFQ